MKKLQDLKSIIDVNLDKLDMPEDAKLRLKNQAKTTSRIKVKRLGFIGIPAVAAIVAFIVFFTGIFPTGEAVKVYAGDLMKEIISGKVQEVDLKDSFLQSTADFSIDLFKQAYTKGKNSLVSPTSVYLALGMTANGADGNTLKEFEHLLGRYDISIKDLNAYYHSIYNKLTEVDSGKVSIANSIWYRDDESLEVKKNFLQANADYYNAAAYKADFASGQTVKDINNWVKNNTGSLINKIIDSIDKNTIMYLINAVYFEDQWKTPYEKGNLRKDNFKLEDGTIVSSDFMCSQENGYLKDDESEGFVKPYKNGKYSFVALLPNEGVTIENYIDSLSGDGFRNLLESKSDDLVNAVLPKFKDDYEIELKNALINMGLKDCFDGSKANFGNMVSGNSEGIYVGKVLHKTFISVDDQGSKAGAATSVEMRTKGISMAHSINLNRPFVYAIVDNETNLPLFIGTMMNPGM